MAETSEGIVINKDVFGGITINSDDQQYSSGEEFGEKLAAAIPVWRSQGIRGVWLKVLKSQSELIPVSVKLDFEFHHAQPGYAMLTLWLPTDDQNRLPPYANQYLGVGGFVVNDKNQVLVIKEKFFVGNNPWKLPGGGADNGEDLAVTARREVLEETGVESEFQSVICFRHQHEFRHGCSDWYFVCLMKAVGGSINPCPQEIAACQWMDIDEFENFPTINDTNKMIVNYYKEMIATGLSVSSQDVLAYNKKKYNKMYHVSKLSPGSEPAQAQEKQ